jgi:hypothetical protein
VRDLAQLFSAKVKKVVEDTTQKLRIVEHLQVRADSISTLWHMIREKRQPSGKYLYSLGCSINMRRGNFLEYGTGISKEPKFKFKTQTHLKEKQSFIF